MAEVFLARQVGVGGYEKLLVIKRILPHLADDPAFVEMFVQEGRIAARLDHPNICHVYELGEVEGQLFLAMEYLDGLPWSEVAPLLPRGGGLDLRFAAGVLGQICEGLAYAHEHRDLDGTPMPIVHRDVSPQNLFVTTTGACKVLDFGVSKVLTETTRTRAGVVKGKLPYMAPEQIRGKGADERSDVFALGVILWEALAGELLFGRTSDYEIWMAVTEAPIPALAPLRPELPAAIDVVLARALARPPGERYQTVREFAVDLRAVAFEAGGALEPSTLRDALRAVAAEPLAQRRAQVSQAAGRPLKPSQPPPISASLSAALAGQAPTPGPSTGPGAVELRGHSVRITRRRRRWPLALVALTSVVAAGAGGWWMLRPARPGGPATEPSSPLQVALSAVDAGPSAPLVSADAAVAVDAVLATSLASTDAEPGPPRGRPRRPEPAPDEAEAAGYFSVDSRPYATIVVDGRSLGVTPLFKVPLAPGRYRVRATRERGRTRTFSINVRSGKVTNSGTLTW